MQFIYGKRDWQTLSRGEENCYLMTNGLGGFSSLTMVGSCSRNDQSILMACTHSPNHRYNMIHRLEEVLSIGGKALHLSSQDFEDRERQEQGFLCQSTFAFEDYPVWDYLCRGVEVRREIVLMQGSNTVGIAYRIRNSSRQAAALTVTPQLQFVRKGSAMVPDQEFSFDPAENRISANGQTLYLRTGGSLMVFPTVYQDGLYYAYDECDGRPCTGCCASNHAVTLSAAPGQAVTLELIYSTEPVDPGLTVDAMEAQVTAYRNGLRAQAGFPDETAQALAAAANQFVSYRSSTNGQTILAGFPFFEDWGRDTMIALGGCCLASRQYEATRSILRTFMAYCRKGLMPNLFPEGKDAPGYNTVDAALLFILCVYDYYQKTQDAAFVREAYSVMEEIVHWYEHGTDFGIRMDEDGLIMAGRGYDQVTWMDVRIGEILPTPRHGKPVEINAYWYNALRILEELKPLADKTAGKDYAAMARLTGQSFREKFWNEKAGCLKDVLSGTKADDQIRCNQIWAVSMPFSVLDRDREKQVVQTVFEKLYTPYGLRTLDPADPEFKPHYGGNQLIRDLAYHQGTVWTFPMGGYYLAYLKVNGYSEDAKAQVRRQLTAITAALWEGCIGQLPEIFDGENPFCSKGCFAQAWSVGEMLRVYDAIR